jgi:hypothetical protein
MVGEIGDDVAAANVHVAVLHEFGLDEKIRINVLFHQRDQRAAHDAVEIRARDEPHAAMASLGRAGIMIREIV